MPPTFARMRCAMRKCDGSQDIIGLSPGTGQFTIGLYADRLRTVTCMSDTYLTVWLTGQLDRPMCFFADSLVETFDVLDTYQTVTFWVQFRARVRNALDTSRTHRRLRPSSRTAVAVSVARSLASLALSLPPTLRSSGRRRLPVRKHHGARWGARSAPTPVKPTGCARSAP